MANAKEKNAFTDLSPEELYDLGQRSSEGDLSARETLILSYLPLVKRLVYKFLGRGVDYDDLYQEGCCGLIEAVTRYDYTRGTPLGAYAYHWINKRLHKAIFTQSKNIPMTIGEKDYYNLCRILGAYRDMSMEKGRPPTYAELADALGVSEEKVGKMFRVIHSFSSLDADSERHQGSFPSAEDTYFLQEDPLAFASGLLTSREKTVLQLYLGLSQDRSPMTFQEVAAQVYWSTETVRKTYYSAVAKLRDALTDDGVPKDSDPFE